MPMITALFQLQNRMFTNIATPSTVTIDEAMQLYGQLYCIILRNGNHVTLDLTRILCRSPNLSLTTQLDTYLSSVMTDQFVATYKAAIDMTNHADTKHHRLLSYDPLGIPGFKIGVGKNYTEFVDVHRNFDYDDLLIQGNAETDFVNSFVIVNGVAHPTVANKNFLFVKNGMSNIRNKKAANIVVGDTKNIGGHRVIPLTRDMMESTNTDPWLGIVLQLSDINLDQTTVLLVIDGTLHLLDDTYSPLSANRLWLNVPRLDLAKNYINNPNITFNSSSRQKKNCYNIVSDIESDNLNKPAPDMTLSSVSYATDITNFLLTVYPSLAERLPTIGYPAPAVLLDVGTNIALLAQAISLFFINTLETISAEANSLVLLKEGPPPGNASVLQNFLTEIYPQLITTNTDSIAQVGLMYLSPMSDDLAYVINDVLVNTYSYLDAERITASVALLSTGLADNPSTELTNSMTQFFNEYYPDMNIPATANQNQNLALTSLETMQSFRISLQGQPGISTQAIQTRSFLYERLFGLNSFLIVIPNPNVFVTKYRLNSTHTAYRYSWSGIMDTPRGLLRYDQRHILPYTLLSAQDYQFLLHIGLPSNSHSLIETAIDFSLWPAPHYNTFDLQSPRDAELIDLYTL